MAITKKYNTPPLIEVLCEFRFDGIEKDFENIEDEFTRKFKNTYPLKQERQNVSLNLSSKNSKITTEFEEKRGLIQYRSDDGSSLMHLGENLLSVNCLPPYQTWEEFLPALKERLSIYKAIAQPNNLTKVSLRYINKIDLEFKNEENMSDYFKYSISLPKNISSKLASLNIRTEHLYNENKDVLAIALRNTRSEQPGVVSLALDLTYTSIEQKVVSFKSLDKWLYNAHININEAFESILTEKCKSTFNK